jgi:hypothetical protein
MSTNPLGVLGGLDDAAAYKVPCKVATLTDMTGAMRGLPIIDGYQVMSGDRILVRANTDQTTNGIWVAETGAWCRSTDFTNSSAVYNGTQIFVVHGATYAGWVFSCLEDYPIIGATPITFANNLVADTQAAHSADLAEQAASTAAAIASTTWGVFPSRAIFAAMGISGTITAVRLLGYAHPGDGGDATYTRIPPPGAPLAGHVQTADGGWWQMARGGDFAVESFGALVTSSDNTNAINDAMTFISTTYQGGTLVYGGGTYTFLGTVTWPQAGGVSMRGCGERTILAFGAGTADALVMAGNAASGIYLQGVVLSDMLVDCSLRTGGRALYVTATFWGPYINNVDFYNVYNGMQFESTNSPTCDTVLVQVVRGQWGIYWLGGWNVQDCPLLTLANVVVNCVYYAADGMWIDGGAATGNFFNLTFLDCRIGLWVKNSAHSVSACVNFIAGYNIVMDGMSLRALQIDGGREFYFTACWFSNTSTPGATGPNQQGFNDSQAIYIGADIGYSYTSDIRFIGCRIGNTKQWGVTIDGPRNIRFQDCLFEPGSKGGVNLYDAIWISTGSQDIMIQNCDFLVWGDPVNWRYGVAVNAGTYRIYIEDNAFYGVNTGPIYWANTDADSYCLGNVWENALPSLPGREIVHSDNVSGSYTISAVNLCGGIYVMGGTPGAFTAITPTAAQIVAQLGDPFYGKTVSIMIVNGTNGACTLQMGSGVTFFGVSSGVNQAGIASASTRVFKMQLTGCAGGAESVTFIG